MKKLLIIPSNKEISDIKKYFDAVLFGMKGYSVNTPCNLNLKDIKEISEQLKNDNKELFISLNKNMVNKDIKDLKNILIELDKLEIKGIFYSDICFVNLKKELNLKTDLVWSNEHVTTNYATINFWKKFGINCTYLSAEITLEEIKEIRNNTTNTLIIPVFGYLPMYVSFRHAVKNYKNQFNITSSDKINYIEKEGNMYPIIDDEIGTTVYSSHILDGYEEFQELDIDYVTLSEFNIDRDMFKKVLKKYRGEESIYNLDTDKGFLYKETVYKVKK